MAWLKHHAACSFCYFVHPEKLHRLINTEGYPWKRFPLVSMDANQWENPPVVVQDWLYCSVFPKGKWLSASAVGKLASSAGTLTCCRPISSTVRWVTWERPAVFVKACAVRSLWLWHLSLLHMGIPWKHRLILRDSGKWPMHCGYIVKLVLFFSTFK